MKNSKVYLNELLDKFPQLTPRERQLCSFFYNKGVDYILSSDRQVPALFKPKESSELPKDFPAVQAAKKIVDKQVRRYLDYLNKD